MIEKSVNQLIQEVLEKGYLTSLGTVDDGGVWVCDVIYIYDDKFNLYWMSKSNVRHSMAIDKNSKVAGSITVNLPQEDNLGTQFEGFAQRIEGQRFDLAKKHYAKRKKQEPKESDDVLGKSFWYVFKPQKIELICEKLFGFKKQILIL